MPKIRKDNAQHDIYYFEETDEEKTKRELKERFKNKIKNKDSLTKTEKDELLITLAKMHGLLD